MIDGGHLFATKSHLQKTANAAALSGAQEIPNAESAVYGVVDEVLSSHGETDSLLQAAVQGDKELLVKLEREVPLFLPPCSDKTLCQSAFRPKRL
ncbi:pilus assembly protein TadG-related protein [Thalassobacillus sp. C254]|uniref:pilus assembly protein TadG-related protein n=1 Tax=Thalassobacillus sp. C254 TaxID=1225341 RepID=UPI000A77307E|nr:pilus assembly protein TadG-related protein [Thalassobacillus sp. C254]